MKFSGKLSWLATFLVVAGCASNEELFAEYDAYCQGQSCQVPETEIVYQEIIVSEETMPWEPAVYFGYDLARLDPAERQRLDSNLKVLKSDQSLKIALQAFTDSVATPWYNIPLAQRRQQAVIDYLLSNGLAENRILARSVNEGAQILDETSPNDRIINRRVQMMLLDGSGRPLSYGIALPDVADQFQPPFPAEKIIE